MLEKKFPYIYKLELPENLKVHPIFHVSFFKLVACDASKPNQKYNSRPPPILSIMNLNLKWRLCSNQGN